MIQLLSDIPSVTIKNEMLEVMVHVVIMCIVTQRNVYLHFASSNQEPKVCKFEEDNFVHPNTLARSRPVKMDETDSK